MSAAASIHDWVEWWLPLAVGATTMIGVAAAAARFAPRAMWERIVWQVCMLSLALLLVGELTGVAHGLIEWGRGKAALDGRWIPLIGGFTGTRMATDLERESASKRGVSGPVPVFSGDNLPDRRHEFQVEKFVSLEESLASAIHRDDQLVSASCLDTVRRESSSFDRIGYWSLVVWLLVTVVLMVRIMVAQFALMVFRYRNRRLCDAELAEQVRALRGSLGVRPVHLLEADGLSGPIAFGLVWPTVVLPRRFASDFCRQQREAILAHEFAHLAARDPGWHLLADIVTAVMWWQPLVWWARGQLRLASEYAADEACLLMRDGPATLAGCLVEFGRRLTRPGSPAWLRIEGNALRSGLARRVTRLLSLAEQNWQPPSWRKALLWKCIGPTALVAVALSCTAWSHPLANEKGDSMTHIIRHSWRQSLAAAALVGVLGLPESIALAEDPQEAQEKILQEANELIKQRAQDKKNAESAERAERVQAERAEKEAIQQAEIEQAVRAEKESIERLDREVAAIQRKIEDFRRDGKTEQAEPLVKKLAEMKAKREKFANEKDAKKTSLKEKAGWDRERPNSDDLRNRLQQLEVENAHLRNRLAEKEGKAAVEKALSQIDEFSEGHARNLKVRLQEIEKELARHRQLGKASAAETLESHANDLRKELQRLQSRENGPEQPDRKKNIGSKLEEFEKLRAARRVEQAEQLAREKLQLAEGSKHRSTLDTNERASAQKRGDANLEKMAQAMAQLQEQMNRLSEEVAELKAAAKAK